MDKIRTHLTQLNEPFSEQSAELAATAIMTTDTHPKVASASAGPATIVGIAKGVGMIEPDMATMIAIITTDAEITPDTLDQTFRRVVHHTFNALSVDTDTSTSDMAVVLASGQAGLKRLRATPKTGAARLSQDPLLLPMLLICAAIAQSRSVHHVAHQIKSRVEKHPY